MANNLTNELHYWESDVFFGVIVMIQVFECNILAIVLFDSGFTNWRALQISAKILDIASVISGRFLQMNHPVFFVEEIEPIVKGGVVFDVFELWRQFQTSSLILLTKEVNHGVAPHSFYGQMIEVEFLAPPGVVID